MQNQIFVYGSLLSHMRHPKGEQLKAEADLVGTATIQGRLYRVSWYPGVTLSTVPSDRVYGEIYRLRDPQSSLAWLDEYEGITSGPTGVAPADQYERRQTQAHLDTGATLSAWIYVYRLNTMDLSHVASGRWSVEA